MATELKEPSSELEHTPGGPSPPSPPSQPGDRPRSRSVILVALIASLFGAAVGSGATLVVAELTDQSSSTNTAQIRVGSGNRSNSQSLTGVAQVAQTVLPSVVRIDIGGAARGRSGTGSGVIFRSDGYIITNDHVVTGAREIQVTLSSGEELPATLVGTASPSDDIAVIKVDRNNLTPAVLGSTKDLTVGDMAIAVGSPFGLEGSVTAGVISALHRNINLGGGTRFADGIQTDAPINPGNSGGALANAQGEVIGINTAAVGASGGSVGVGFAIPINIARRDAEQIIETGRASRPFLGISGDSIPNGGGARIDEVGSGGPAAAAGLRAGDVITQIEDVKVASMEELISALIELDVDQTVSIVYKRDNETLTAKVKLGALPEG
jgi:putative serine protease PepD